MTSSPPSFTAGRIAAIPRTWGTGHRALSAASSPSAWRPPWPAARSSLSPARTRLCSAGTLGGRTDPSLDRRPSSSLVPFAQWLTCPAPEAQRCSRCLPPFSRARPSTSLYHHFGVAALLNIIKTPEFTQLSRTRQVSRPHRKTATPMHQLQP